MKSGGLAVAAARTANFVWRRERLILVTIVGVVGLLAGLGFFASRRPRAGPDPLLLRPAKAPITRTPMAVAGDVPEAVISPDGGLVAYVKTEGIYQTAYVQPTAGGAATAVLAPTETAWHDLTFSPDSHRLFLSHNDPTTSLNVLYEVPVAGGRMRRVITDVDSAISFAPDGGQFVFRRNDPDRRESSIILANVDGSGERKLATRQIAEGFDNGPAWSPDGRTVASVATDPTAGDEQQRGIVVIDVADGTVRALGRTRWRWTTRLAWVADGRELLLDAKDQALSPFQIWRVGYPAGDVLNATNDTNSYSVVSTTTDTSTLLTVQVTTMEALSVGPVADLSQVHRLTPEDHSTPETAVRFYGVSWTPDGRILFGSNAGGHRSIWVANADGSGQTRLTRDEFVNENPVATSDGRYVVYQSEQSGYANIWRMNHDGSDARQLTFGVSATSPSVTPDSRWVVYDASSVATARLFKVSIDGGTPQELTTATSHFPVVSPDGRSIAFLYYAGGTAPTTLSIVGIDGGTPRLNFPVPVEKCRWERDGRALICVDKRPGRASFMRLPLDTGVPTPIAASNGGRVSAFDISRDGRRVVFVRVTSESRVVRMGGFR